MRLARIELPKAKLLSVPEIEQVFFIQATHLMNDLNTLQKCVYFSSRPVENDVQRRAEIGQAMFFNKFQAAKLWEGWQMLQKSFFGSALSREYEGKMSPLGQESLRKLKAYFSGNNLVSLVRNEFEFHTPDAERIKELLRDAPGNEVFEVYAHEYHGNCRYFISDVVVGFAILNAINREDPEQAMGKLLEETHSVTRLFLDFLGDCVTIFLRDHDFLQAHDVEIPDPPDIDDVHLPYFIISKKKQARV